jgi:hypothetical protein
MKTMHRTSAPGMAIGTVVTAGAVIALTAFTGAGARGTYAFLFVGMLIFMLFLMWPERTRPFRGGRRRVGGSSARTARVDDPSGSAGARP